MWGTEFDNEEFEIALAEQREQDAEDDEAERQRQRDRDLSFPHLSLALAAERYNHRKDNEYLIAKCDRYQQALEEIDRIYQDASIENGNALYAIHLVVAAATAEERSDG